VIYNFFIRTRQKTLIIMFGESNSGGTALNSQATALELSARSRVQIWDNVNNDSFDNLQIPVNSLLKHMRLEEYNGTKHGMELQLANYVYNNHFGTNEIYLVKAGQGGTRARQWVENTLYYDYYLWDEWKNRVLGAIAKLRSMRIRPSIKIMFSLGINDSIDGLDAETFKNRLKQLITMVDAEIGVVPWYATRIMRTNANYIAIDDALVEVSNEVSNFNVVSITGAGLQDSNHWSYSGFKLIVDRMITAGLN